MSTELDPQNLTISRLPEPLWVEEGSGNAALLIYSDHLIRVELDGGMIRVDGVETEEFEVEPPNTFTQQYPLFPTGSPNHSQGKKQ